MNIFIDNTLNSDSYNAPIYIAHESFHAYQLYKGSMIGTCHSEVEAYLYSYAVFDRLGKVAQNMLLPKFEDATYNNAFSNILLKSFNKKDFDYVVLNFKNISTANANGVYNNLKQTLNNMYLLTPFYPLIP